MSSIYLWVRENLLKNPLVFVYILPIMLWVPALTGLYDQDPSVFVASVGHFAKLRFGSPWIDPNVGFQAQALGKLSADLWLRGTVPWWNSYSGVGLPLAAEMQPGALFLPFILLYHFRSGGMWVELLLQLIAGQFTYLLLRKLKIVNFVSVMGAILYELNGTFAWHGAPITSPVAFLPMILFGVELLRGRVERSDIGGWYLISVALALSLYAGFPETAYIDGLFVGVWCVTRCVGLAGEKKRQFIKYLSFSVVTGLFLAAPLLLPFLEYLSLSMIGGHKDTFAHAALPKAAFLQFLIPYSYGPIWGFGSQNNVVSAIWGNVGGFFTGMQFFVALSSFFLFPSRLTFVLIVWILACLGKIYNLPVITELFNLIPFIKSAAFFRYANPCISMAGVILVSFAVDGLIRNINLCGHRLVLLFAGFSLFFAAGIFGATDVISSLLYVEKYKNFFYPSIIWFTISIILTVLAFQFRKNHQKKVTTLLCFLLCLDAALNFVVPIFSGMERIGNNDGGIKFLMADRTLSRSYSMGPLSPNYGAYFKVAQINHNYLPVSKAWTDYIHAHLDSAADEITFIGTDSVRKGFEKTSAEELLENESWYAGLGVKYILSPPNSYPFYYFLSSREGGAGNILFSLKENEDMDFNIIVRESKLKRAIESLDIFIGNYNNTSDGKLVISICREDNSCVKGSLLLSGSKDNAMNRIVLDSPLDIVPGRDAILNLVISHVDGKVPFAIWMWPASKGNPDILARGKAKDLLPQLTLNLGMGNIHRLSRVYGGSDMDIYELPDPAPYFDINNSSCVATAKSRTEALISCNKPGVLIRRELYYPGWRSLVNGMPTPVSLGDELFQKVNLPKGKYVVSFDYRPTYFYQSIIVFVIGMIFLLYPGCVRLIRKKAKSFQGALN